MSVFRRKMFGGGYAHRGTGITSGLTPVQRFQEGGKATIRPEMLPAWMTFFGNLGTPTFKTGFGAISEDIRGAAKATAPVLAKGLATGKKEGKYFWAYNTTTDRHERVTDATFNPKIHTKDAPEADTSDEDWSDPTEVNVLFKNDETGLFTEPGILMRKFQKSTGEFEYQDTDNKVVSSDTFKLALKDEDKGDQEWEKENVLFQSKTDPNADPFDGFRIFDQESGQFKFLQQDGITPVDMTEFNVITKPEDDEEQAEKTGITGSITVDGKKYPNVTFVQKGDDFFVIDPRQGSGTFGQPILLHEISGLEDWDMDPNIPKYVATQEDIENKIRTEKNLGLKYGLAETGIKLVTDKALNANERIKNNTILKEFLDQATAGSYADQRNALLRLFDTFGLDEVAPDVYAKFEELLRAGKVPPTEMILAMSEAGTLNRALQWSQQLNKSELGMLIKSGSQAYLTKEGQILLTEANLADAEIQATAAQMAIDAIADPKSDALQIWKDITDYQDQAYKKFLERPEIQRAIEIVKNYDNIGDIEFFSELGTIDFVNGVSVDAKQAYKEGRIRFGGYADIETGSYVDPIGDEHTILPSKLNKPIYYIIPSKEEFDAAEIATENRNAIMRQF